MKSSTNVYNNENYCTIAQDDTTFYRTPSMHVRNDVRVIKKYRTTAIVAYDKVL